MKYNICVPIQVKSVNLSDTTPTIKKVVGLNPNLIELRLDYIKDVQMITKDFIISLLRYINPKIPVICTLRDSNEGGQVKLDINQRFQIIKLIIEAEPNYIDIEINTEKSVLNEIIHLVKQHKINLIFSYHDFQKTPTYSEASNLLDRFFEKLVNEMNIDSKTIEQSIFKLVFTAHSFEDNLVPLKLCKEKTSKKQRLISFCMDDLGLFSRIFSIFSGSFLTYGSFEEKTASGQMPMSEIRAILKLLNFSS